MLNKNDPTRKEKLFMKVHKPKSAFTLIEIMIVVAIVGVLAAIAVPNFVKSRTQSQTGVCIDNLRQIDHSKEQLAMEANLPTGTAVTEASVNTFIKGANTPACPAGGSYSYNNTGTNPSCNIANHVLQN
jgi:prepilin-type N-terminal cleavage/methylation domain-containing protein